MLSIAEFYAESHFRDPFGQKRPGTNDHRGLDIGGWPEGTLVPAWATGRIVTSEYNGALGWVVVADTDHGLAGVSHLQHQGASVGALVRAGEAWGPLGDTGSLSQGPHAHLTLSHVSRYPWAGAVTDPTPGIRAARSSAPAGGGATPIANRKEPTVFIARRKGAAYLIVPAEGGKLFASVLGGQDVIDGLPSITYNWDTAWMQFRSRLVNPGNVPA